MFVYRFVDMFMYIVHYCNMNMFICVYILYFFNFATYSMYTEPSYTNEHEYLHVLTVYTVQCTYTVLYMVIRTFICTMYCT